MRRKHEELLQDGKYIGQHRVFGYRWDGGLVVVGDEAELIREAVHRVLNGEALNAICRDWNQRGIRTVEGNPWRQRSLKRVLVSGRISGRRDYGIAPGGGRLAIPRIVTDGDWPAIVDPELSDEVRTRWASNSRPSAPRRHLLTGGLTRCAVCGAHLQPRVESGVKGGLALHCRRGNGYHGCGRVSVTMEPLERFVVTAVLEAIDMAALRAALDRRDDPGAREELADVDGRLAELARMWGERQLTGPEWAAAKAPLNTRRQSLVRRIEASRRTVALDDLPDRLREGWQDLPLLKRRAVLAAIIEAVNVHPAGRRGERFTEERVTMRWRA